MSLIRQIGPGGESERVSDEVKRGREEEESNRGRKKERERRDL